MTPTGVLAKLVNIEDLRHHARTRLPKIVFDYFDGGAEAEITSFFENSLVRAHPFAQVMLSP